MWYAKKQYFQSSDSIYWLFKSCKDYSSEYLCQLTHQLFSMCLQNCKWFFFLWCHSWHKYFQWWLMNVISHILTLNYSERHGSMERILVLNVLYLMLWLIYPLLRMWKVYSGWTFLIFRLFDRFCRIKIKVFSGFHNNIFIDSFLCLIFEWNSVS